MNQNDMLLLSGAGALAYMLLRNVGDASAADSSFVKTAGAGFVDKQLTEINGANWTVPLFLTLERDVPLGFYDTLWSVATTVGSTAYTAAAYAGEAIMTALSTANQIVSGTVIPAVINAGGTAATYIKIGAEAAWSGISTGAGYIGDGLSWVGGNVWDYTKIAGEAVWNEAKALPGQIAYIGGKAWDYATIAGGYVWDNVAGIFKSTADYLKKSDTLQAAAKAVGTVAAGAVIANNTDNKVTTNPQQDVLKGGVPGPNTPQIIPIGYLSKTPFDTPKSLIVKKMYSSQTNDTRIVTDQETYNASIALGYKDMETLGYCSPDAFLGAVNMISMYNPKTLDSIIITNYDVIPQMKQLGYQSLGTIGYCKGI